MDIFGDTDPKLMPRHLFGGAYQLDYASAIRGNPAKQNFSVCPRHWYLDAIFKCDMCRENFTWSAAEQKTWFEQWHFWIDSVPNQCPQCRKLRREAKAARQEYDAIVEQARQGNDLTLKARVLALIDEMTATDDQLPAKIKETYEAFTTQLKKAK